MNVIATARYIHQSPRKVRLVATAVREMTPTEALGALRLSDVKAAKVVEDVLKSAIANATNNFQLPESSLRILTLEVGEGPTLKRVRARSRGMANSIQKRTSHVRVVLTDEPLPAKKQKAEASTPRRSAAKPVAKRPAKAASSQEEVKE